MNLQKTADSPLVKSIILSVINNSEKFSYEKKYMINSELIPRVSKRLIDKKILSEGRTMMRPSPFPPRQFPQQIAQITPRITRPATTVDLLTKPEGYGKLQPLLVDQMVTSIECSGADKQLTIMMAGQILPTKIILSQKDIADILKTISEKTKIPLVEGVFRAAIDNLVINAVVSKMIGSRFIIKKQTPYSLLENR